MSEQNSMVWLCKLFYFSHDDKNIFYDLKERIMILSQEEKNYLYKNKSVVDNICRPLFSQTDISYFDYQHYFHDGGLLALSSRPDFMESYLINHYYPTLQELNTQFNLKARRFVFMSEGMVLPTKAAKHNPQKYINNIMLSKSYGIHHRVYFAQKSHDHIKVCGFGTDTDNRAILEYYLNSVDLLERFITYFQCRAYDLIHQKNRAIIYLPNFFGKAKDNKAEPSKTYDISLFPDNYKISIENKTIKLSQREMECLVLKLKGGSAKAIGRFLSISNRTVEKILCNVYEKAEHQPMHILANTLEQVGIFKLFQDVHVR